MTNESVSLCSLESRTIMLTVQEHFPAKYQNVPELQKDKPAYLSDALDCTINMFGFNKLNAKQFNDCNDEVGPNDLI